MDMQGLVLGVDVRDSVFYDQLTGEEKPAYTLVLEVVDMGVKARPKHTCQIQEGYPLVDELKALKKQKRPAEAQLDVGWIQLQSGLARLPGLVVLANLRECIHEKRVRLP